MPWAWYREQIANGRITRADIAQAIARCRSTLGVEDVERTLETPAPKPRMGMASVAEVLDCVEGGLWASFVTERVSLHCAAWFDLGQAIVPMPWRDRPLYAAWREAARIDRSPAMMGLHGFRDRVNGLPEAPRAAIAWALGRLGIPEPAVERYLHAALLSIGGWAAWARYLRWQAELQGRRDDAIVDLLAVRVMWDVLLLEEKRSPALEARWREMLAASMRPPSAKRQAAAEIDRILLAALEIGFQRSVIHGLATAAPARLPSLSTLSARRPAVQAAFCIDVRSEVFRRSLETVAPDVQTIGFAGFFGIFIEVAPLGAEVTRSHVPVIFNAASRIDEQPTDGDTRLAETRRERIRRAKGWKGFKLSAASCFSFVEAAGLLYAPKLLTDSLGWTRPVPEPLGQGLTRLERGRIAPVIDPRPALGAADPAGRGLAAGIPPGERVNHAERILRAMAMTRGFARLVLLAGHGSTSVNNPHATSLDCGACAGQTGEASARVVAALLNDPDVRRGLISRGIVIPEDTWFVPALHDTTTDEVTLFDTEAMPAALKSALAPDLARLGQWLAQAGELTRLERALNLGIARRTAAGMIEQVRALSRDWSQVRPEWALANNAAFIAAPRARTQGLDLAGRAFLHEYVWQQDAGFKILELIMTAPMVVANWINMQYYGSVIDNRRFGSGNKVLHNVVGGAIGVLEGNGGDLRVGLPLQSLHDGRRWMHEPIRLSVFIEAPEAAIEEVIANHTLVRQLVDHGWLHLFRIAYGGHVTRRVEARRWEVA